MQEAASERGRIPLPDLHRPRQGIRKESTPVEKIWRDTKGARLAESAWTARIQFPERAPRDAFFTQVGWQSISGSTVPKSGPKRRKPRRSRNRANSRRPGKCRASFMTRSQHPLRRREPSPTGELLTLAGPPSPQARPSSCYPATGPHPGSVADPSSPGTPPPRVSPMRADQATPATRSPA